MAINKKIARGDISNSREPVKVNYRASNPHAGMGYSLFDPKVMPKVVRDELEANRRAREMVRKIALLGPEEVDRLAAEAEAKFKDYVENELKEKYVEW